MFELKELKGVLEALLFVADEPLSPKKLGDVLAIDASTVKTVLESLRDEYQRDNRGIQLRRVAGGYRFFSHPAHAPYVEKLILAWDGRRLTQAALETLAIIAYRQPITKITVSAIRGVNSERVVITLVNKGLVKELGREKSPGQPILYGTTKLFLERFGLNSIKDLPPLEEFEPDEETKEAIQQQLYAGDTATDTDSAIDKAVE